jgi:GntR family transcriptional regulator/MocR family aminotransferase
MLPIALDLTAATSLQSQIIEQIRSAIVHGTISPGAALPSSRELAQTLQISRKTAVLAYQRLEEEGYVSIKHGAGTYISEMLPESCISSGLQTRSPESGKQYKKAKFPDVVTQVGTLNMVQHGPTNLQFDFWYGGVNWRNFPLREWRQLLIENLSRTSMNVSGYGPPEGIMELRQAIAEHVSRSRAIPATAQQVVITSGSQEAFNLISRLFVQAGTRVVVENPCYSGAALVFKSFGADLLPVDVDASGLRTDLLQDCGATLVYVTPSHQFPTGVTMSAERRLSLLHWAEDNGAYIVEDDYDSDFRYDGPPFAALAGIERNASVIYVGTFSKSLGSGLRTGYLIVPEQLIEPMRRIKALANYGHPWLEQIMLADLINSGGFARHLRRIRRANSDCRAAMLESLHENFGAVQVSGSEAGMHVMWTLPRYFPPAEDIVRIAAENGIGVYTLTSAGAFEADQKKKTHALVLGYSALTPEAIRKGVRRFGEVLERAGIQPRRIPGKYLSRGVRSSIGQIA